MTEVLEVMVMMARTIGEIEAHADELAERFEAYEPRSADELDVNVILELRAALAERAAAEQHVASAIAHARSAGTSWAVIGTLVGTSGEAARQRYGRQVA